MAAGERERWVVAVVSVVAPSRRRLSWWLGGGGYGYRGGYGFRRLWLRGYGFGLGFGYGYGYGWPYYRYPYPPVYSYAYRPYGYGYDGYGYDSGYYNSYPPAAYYGGPAVGVVIGTRFVNDGRGIVSGGRSRTQSVGI